MPCVSGAAGGDPAAVAFDAIEAAIARGARHGHRGHRGPAAHAGGPDGRAAEGGARRRPAAPGRAARDAARARRHGGAERRAAGPALRRGGAADRPDRDQARRHRAGRRRRGAAARTGPPDPVPRAGREGVDDLDPVRPPGLRRGISLPTRDSAPPALRLDTPVKFLKGVGERRADAFARLGIVTAQDLLWHLPHRYLDASSVTPLARARVGEEVACIGQGGGQGSRPDPAGAPDLPRGAPRRLRRARVRLAGAGLPRPDDPGRPDAARGGPGAFLPRAADGAHASSWSWRTRTRRWRRRAGGCCRSIRPPRA